LAGRIAEAIHKLHQARIPTARIHRMEDELRILDRCLEEAASMAPQWAGRLVRINAACRSLGQTLPIPLACGIHRDFYPAQVLIYKRRIILLDFDLYCLGDPALDIGNFIGHMQEQGLREFQDFRALDQPARALRERFLQLSGESRRAAVEAYTTLTLARHIYLSMNFSERRPFTERLIEICEDKLALPAVR
jgi:thiamine kinase-like enzyme